MKLSKETIAHLKTHVEYPISRAELLKTCDGWSESTAADKKAAERLPNKTFSSANDVLKALSV